jgi:ubiquinone/menaquinone biosynthesis C-methylase UbiE
MRHLARALLLLPLLVTVVSADGYRDSLIARYPYYQNATGRFAPLYPALAKQIVEDYGITEGVCVDVGGGCGSLALELAKITNLKVYVLDIDPIAVALCNVLADEAGLSDRVFGVVGDAQNMLLRDGFADLVVSRGSIFFWPDPDAGIRECWRILKPGGVAFVGGGFSRLMDKATLDELVKWAREKRAAHPEKFTVMDNATVLAKAKEAGIATIRIIDDGEFEWWVEMRK